MSKVWLVWRGEWDGRHLFGVYYSREVAAAWADYARATGAFESERRSVKIVEQDLVTTLPPPVPAESMSDLLDRLTVDKPIEGKVFVVTGTLPKRSRDETKELIAAAGGEVVDYVTASVDYLVAGEKAGSKLDRAEFLKKTVLSEADLEKLLGIR